MPSRVKTWTSITVPLMPEGTRRLVSFTSEAFSPKIARRSFSSGVSWVSPLGVDVHDARLTQPRELRFGQVRDVARDFLGPELGVACDHRQLLDMDRGE